MSHVNFINFYVTLYFHISSSDFLHMWEKMGLKDEFIQK